MSASNWSLVMPALATTTSTGPCAASATLNASSTNAASLTSHLATVSPAMSSPEREVIVTASPASANRRAMASPIPRLPPVTRMDRLMVHLRGKDRVSQYRRPARSGGLEPEADLHPHLEMGDFTIFHLATDLCDLEPVQVPQGLGRPVQTVSDGRIDAVW